jgi:hypothetical protein
MNVYRADWSGAGMGDLPASPAILGIVSGKTLRDRLDVADIADEREHRYRFRSTDGQYQGVLEMLSAEGGTAPFLDGGRVISREERFHPKNLSPGSDLVLVMRSRGGFRVRVQVDGQDAGEWLEPGSGGPNWTESALTVPGGMIRAPNPEIRLLTAEPHATAWPAFHYWFYQ